MIRVSVAFHLAASRVRDTGRDDEGRRCIWVALAIGRLCIFKIRCASICNVNFLPMINRAALMQLSSASYQITPIVSTTLPSRHRSHSDSGKRKNVLLVIAHPDDESMFFAPTLLSLASMGSYNVRILCFSNGNAEGLGTIRTQEMRSACSVLKVPQEQIEIFDHPDLQDGHNMVWNIDIIVEELKRSISLHNIGTIITFDNHGVSGHPNHIAVYRGICACLLNWEKSAGTEIKIEAWKLESTNIIVKYIGPISFLWSIWKGGCSTHMHCFYSKDLKINFAAMSRHATQWLWYRRLFVLFSFYSYTNMLHKIN